MVEEPENVPPGRYTLTQVIECIADHYKDKNMYTAQVLADRIKVDKKLMGTVIIHFQCILSKCFSKQNSFIKSCWFLF